MENDNRGNGIKAKNGKHHKPAPEQYKPKPKVVIDEPAKKDPALIWNACVGVVEISGMRFRVTKMKSNAGDYEYNAVYVLEAPIGTTLHGMGGSVIYLTIAQLHASVFRTKVLEGSFKRKRQERMWNFLNEVFIKEGIKQVYHSVRPKSALLTARPPEKVVLSSSMDDFISGVFGKYCFEEISPQAVFQIKLVPYRRKSGTGNGQVLVAELLLADYGHLIYDYVCPGTYMFHNVLSWGRAPNFKGKHAGDLLKMWEFLTDLIISHKKIVASEKKVSHFGGLTESVVDNFVRRYPNVSYAGHA